MPFLAWLINNQLSRTCIYFCLSSLLVGESTVETLGWTSHGYCLCTHQRCSEDCCGQIKPRCRKSKQPQLSSELQAEEGRRKPTTLTKNLHLPVWFSSQSLEESTGFPHKHSSHPSGTHPPAFAFMCCWVRGKLCTNPCMWMCTCLFMHELSSPELCTDQQGSLNSPTVKCVAFNQSLPFGFHIMHYQQWLFSTQVPFRKL